MHTEEENLKASIGAGCLVYFGSQVLLVQVNYGDFKGCWILPGGMAQPGEHPQEAAKRETLEETGLNVKVTTQVAVRHRLYPDNTSNLYFVFSSELIDWHKTTPPPLRWPKEELMDAKFWDIHQAMENPNVRPMTRAFIQMGLKAKDRHFQFIVPPSPSKFNDVIYGVET